MKEGIALEAGHYYQAKGATRWSTVGWSILARHALDGDERILFVDDVHTIEQVNKMERELPVVPFTPTPPPTTIIYESEVRVEALEALEALKKLSKQSSNGKWYCGNHTLTKANGDPLCLLLDVGLSLRKYRLGYQMGINIVPHYYEAEQRALVDVLAKVAPDFEQVVYLHDLEGDYRVM